MAPKREREYVHAVAVRRGGMEKNREPKKARNRRGEEHRGLSLRSHSRVPSQSSLSELDRLSAAFSLVHAHVNAFE